MLLEAPLFKKKQANSCLSLLIGLAETNINFAKFRLRRKIFEKTSQAGTTFASNVIRSTTVEERKAITHLSLMIEKKEQEAITHVSLSLSLSVDTQASPRKSTQPAGQRTKRMHGCKPLLVE